MVRVEGEGHARPGPTLPARRAQRPAGAVNDGVNSGPGFCFLYGSHIDFDVATLSALYPKHSDYTSAVKEATKANVSDGFLLPEDVQTTRDQAERSFIGYGYPCGAVCRASQTLRVLTDGALVPGDDKLLKSLDESTVSLARGDGRAAAKKKAQNYQAAKTALQKYVDDLHKLSAKGQVPATVFPDLLSAATQLIADIDDLIGAA